MYGSKWQTQYNKQKLHGKEKKRQLKKIDRKNEKKNGNFCTTTK
jgi:hypothetical protein